MAKHQNNGYRLYKATYQGGREASKWTIEFNDQSGRKRPRRLTAFADKRASDELGRTIVKLVGCRVSNASPDAALSRAIEVMPKRVCKKLAEWGLIDGHRHAGSKTLEEHVADWYDALIAKGASEKHAKMLKYRVTKINEGCSFVHFSDIQASRVLTFLNDLRQDTDKKRGISAQTFNFYVKALKQFCRWMQKDRRTSESPVDHLDVLNVRTDRRHDRRVLTEQELRRLIGAASKGTVRRGMTGPERAMIYRLAVETGLRSSEIASLTCDSFDLDAQTPAVTVRAAYSKRRRDDLLPLRPELAEHLRAFLATKTPKAKAFNMPRSEKVIHALRGDLKEAGIKYRDDSGKVADFHALRHTFITNLANGGVHPKTAQALARHSTITLTMDRYTHSYLEEESTALSVLPNLDADDDQEITATGTDDVVAGVDCSVATHEELTDPRLASCLAFSDEQQRTTPDTETPIKREWMGIEPTRGMDYTPLNDFEDRGRHQAC